MQPSTCTVAANSASFALQVRAASKIRLDRCTTCTRAEGQSANRTKARGQLSAATPLLIYHQPACTELKTSPCTIIPWSSSPYLARQPRMDAACMSSRCTGTLNNVKNVDTMLSPRRMQTQQSNYRHCCTQASTLATNTTVCKHSLIVGLECHVRPSMQGGRDVCSVHCQQSEPLGQTHSPTPTTLQPLAVVHDASCVAKM